MTTEAVELTCGACTECRSGHSTDGGWRCGKPIRQRTSGPCVVRQGRGEATTCDREWDEHHFDEQLTLGHEHDPGYDHVDLEGACAECGELPGHDLHDGPEPGIAFDHLYVPPVLPVEHESTP